jgi:hypothetical protein
MQESLSRFTCRRCGNEAHGGGLWFLYEHAVTVEAGADDPVRRACAAAARWVENHLGGTATSDATGVIRIRVDDRVAVIQPDAGLGVAYLSGEDAAADGLVERIADGLRGLPPDPAASAP